MKPQIVRILCAMCLALGLLSCTDFDARNAPAERVDDTTLIVLTKENPSALIADVQARGYVLLRREDLAELGDTLISLKIPDRTTLPEAIDEVEGLQPGSTAGANHAYRLQAAHSEQLTVRNVDKMIGWPAQTCLANGRVGMVDAGIATSHPGLARNQIVQENFSQSGALPRSDHGTLMADIMLAEQRLGSVRLFSANVIDPQDGDGNIAGAEAIVRSLDWMLRNDVPVVNISLAGPHNKILRRGLEAATRKGLIVVAAAGNQGPNAPPLYPAAYPFTIAATAINLDLEIYDRAVHGAQIDIAAPGVDVLVQSENRLRIVSGTSVAATFVTSAIVTDPAIKQAPSLEAVRAMLSERATDLGPKGRDPVFGVGLVRARGTCP